MLVAMAEGLYSLSASQQYATAEQTLKERHRLSTAWNETTSLTGTRLSAVVGREAAGETQCAAAAGSCEL